MWTSRSIWWAESASGDDVEDQIRSDQDTLWESASIKGGTIQVCTMVQVFSLSCIDVSTTLVPSCSYRSQPTACCIWIV
jgi:hypothetical protein